MGWMELQPERKGIQLTFHVEKHQLEIRVGDFGCRADVGTLKPRQLENARPGGARTSFHAERHGPAFVRKPARGGHTAPEGQIQEKAKSPFRRDFMLTRHQ